LPATFTSARCCPVPAVAGCRCPLLAVAGCCCPLLAVAGVAGMFWHRRK
jgi:hypothetical protein